MRLIAVLAHPGDESGEGAATLARYAATGHEVMVVTCADDVAHGALPESATEILGVGHHQLGFTITRAGGPASPGQFSSVPAHEPTRRLVLAVREFRPHVMITHDGTGNPHPDYVRCHEVAVAAFDAAGDPARFPATGGAWQPLKLYYLREWHEERIAALHDALLAEGLESPFQGWLDERVDSTERVTTQVPCAEYFELRDRAVRTGTADRHWSAVPVRVRRAVWPTEAFELVRSYVDTSLPEDDLCAGIRATQ